MSHSVSSHLKIAVDRYDAAIRQFIRGYEQMLERAVDAVLSVQPLVRVLDLGAGTGALAERLLERHASCVVELWDVDAAMLEQASIRLSRFRSRVVLVERSFDQVAGPADAIMASLALHHVLDLDAKRALYRSLASSLRPGGVFVNADVTIPAEPAAARAEYRAWADHLVASGIDEQRAWRHFEEWSEEDRYFAPDEELAALASAGFEPACAWRLAPSTVLVGTL